MDWATLAAAGVLTIVPGAIVIWFVRHYIAKGFAMGRVCGYVRLDGLDHAGGRVLQRIALMLIGMTVWEIKRPPRSARASCRSPPRAATACSSAC
jgi:hypothetical protein